jgi:hypothetical protein
MFLQMKFLPRAATVAAIAALMGLLTAGPAIAASTKAPPGVSGAVQYTETLPAPGGNKTTKEIEGEDSSTKKKPSEQLGAKHAAKLEALGPEGQAAANLAADGTTSGETTVEPEASTETEETTQPEKQKSDKKKSDKKKHKDKGGKKDKKQGGAAAGPGSQDGGPKAPMNSSGAEGSGSSNGSSSVGQIADHVLGSSGSQGMGLLQPLLLLLAAIAAVTYVVGQRRSSSDRG